MRPGSRPFSMKNWTSLGVRKGLTYILLHQLAIVEARGALHELVEHGETADAVDVGDMRIGGVVNLRYERKREEGTFPITACMPLASRFLWTFSRVWMKERELGWFYISLARTGITEE